MSENYFQKEERKRWRAHQAERDKILEIITEDESESFQIIHFEMTEERVKREKMGGIFGGGSSYREVMDLEPGHYVKLILKGSINKVVMSNTPMEINTNRQIIKEANGDVLIGGLGMGVILLLMDKNKLPIKSITIIEREQEIIDMVAPKVFPHLKNIPQPKLIHANILEWKPPKGQKWDTIYFDIWNDVCSDHCKDMALLHRRFSKRLNRENPDAWMNSWRKDDMQYLLRQDRREERAREFWYRKPSIDRKQLEGG